MREAAIEKQNGQAFAISKGYRIEIVDLEGQQVADLFAICAEDHKEFFSAGVTLMMSNSLYPKVLYSNKYRPMLTIEKDDVGVHDFFIPCCRQESYAFLKQGDHANCLDNLNAAFAEYNITPFPSITAMSIFMSMDILPDKSLKYRAAPSAAGDSIVFHAEMDIIIGITACSDNTSIVNNRICTPIGVRIY